jgi:hypothetical protein
MFPPMIVRFMVVLDAIHPDPVQEHIVRYKRPDVLDLPHPSSAVVEDEEAPAPIIPAHLRAGQVYGTIRQFTSRLVTEERAGLRKLFKDTRVIKNIMLVRIHGHQGLFIGVPVVDEEAVISILLFDAVDKAKMCATISALETFKRHKKRSFSN